MDLNADTGNKSQSVPLNQNRAAAKAPASGGLNVSSDTAANRLGQITPSTDTNIFKNAGNYTGKELKAAEPVYDPEYVAKKIVSLAKHPKQEIIVGPVGKFIALFNAHLPKRAEKVLA